MIFCIQFRQILLHVLSLQLAGLQLILQDIYFALQLQIHRFLILQGRLQVVHRVLHLVNSMHGLPQLHCQKLLHSPKSVELRNRVLLLIKAHLSGLLAPQH